MKNQKKADETFTIDYTVDPFLATGTIKTEFHFTALPSGGEAPYTFSWDFGDGSEGYTTSSPLPVSHTFPQAGDYHVILTATSNDGKTAKSSSSKATINVHTPSHKRFSDEQIKKERSQYGKRSQF